MNTIELKNMAADIRKAVVEMSYDSRVPHLGSALSCVDILTFLYFKWLSGMDQGADSEGRDRFILSKGHAIAAQYATLYKKGWVTKEQISDFASPGALLEEHPGPACVPGIEAATGSLGHGLSIGTGMALSEKIKTKGHRVYILISDGECNEGSVWEAAMFAAANALDNLCVIVDFNKWQATGRSCDVMALEPLAEKFKAFGWYSQEVDGHDMSALESVFSALPFNQGKPVAVIAHTIKGKGISFMQDDNNWHYRIPTIDEVEKSKEELGF